MSESSNAGRWLADQRPIRTVKCQHCGNTHELVEVQGDVAERDLREALAFIRANAELHTAVELSDEYELHVDPDSVIEEISVSSVDAARRLNILLSGLEVDARQMRANIDRTRGFAMSQRVALALAHHIPRGDAEKLTKDIIAQAGERCVGQRKVGVAAFSYVVQAAAAMKYVIACSADQHVTTAALAKQRVITIASVERVDVGSRKDIIVTGPGLDDIIAGPRLDEIIATAGDHRVVPASADHGDVSGQDARVNLVSSSSRRDTD